MTPEQRIAKGIVEHLNEGTAKLDAAAATRLAAARQQAVEMAAAQVHASRIETVHAGVGHFFLDHLHGQRSWMTIALLLGAALLAVVLVQQNIHREPVEGDALLLASDLPPEAYVDKGFDAWLEQSSQL